MSLITFIFWFSFVSMKSQRASMARLKISAMSASPMAAKIRRKAIHRRGKSRSGALPEKDRPAGNAEIITDGILQARNAGLQYANWITTTFSLTEKFVPHG